MQLNMEIMDNMKTKDIKALLIAVNASGNFFQYPIGNKELTEKLKELEEKKLIEFNKFEMKWKKA